MNTTGTSNSRSSSLTASRPELPSASWMSARIRPGVFFLAISTASLWVRATPMTFVAEVLDQAFQIHGNERLILDDENVGGDFGRKLAAGRVGILADILRVAIKDEGDLILGEALQREQQEDLARQRRDVRQPLLGARMQRHHVGILVDGHRVPDFREDTEQPGAGTLAFIQQVSVLQQGFQHGRHVGIARRLAAGQGAGIAP